MNLSLDMKISMDFDTLIGTSYVDVMLVSISGTNEKP